MMRYQDVKASSTLPLGDISSRHFDCPDFFTFALTRRLVYITFARSRFDFDFDSFISMRSLHFHY